MRERFLMPLALLGAGLLTVACGDDGDDDDTASADAGVDGGGGGGTPDGGRDGGVDGGPPTDGNDEIADAVALTLGGDPVTGTFDFAGDPDFYSFESTANQWVLFRVSGVTPSTGAAPDPFIIVFDEAEEPFAANVDQVAGGAAGELAMRLPTAGTWYVQVAAENAVVGNYTILTREITEQPGFTFDDELGDTAAEATTLTDDPLLGGTPELLLGDFEDSTDVDVYSFSVSDSEPRWILFGGFYQGGRSMRTDDGITLGSGSTAQLGRVWVTDADGDILARLDPAVYGGNPPVARTVIPSLVPGRYFLWVEPTGTIGSNPFYFGRIAAQQPENRPEINEPGNDTTAGAEDLVFTGVNSFILSFLPDGDTDHWNFAIANNQIAIASCSSRLSGSGVVGLTGSILNDSGNVINRCTFTTGGTTTNDQACTSVEMPGQGGVTLQAGRFGSTLSPGEYYLRLTKTGQVPSVEGDWVRCLVQVGTPADPGS